MKLQSLLPWPRAPSASCLALAWVVTLAAAACVTAETASPASPSATAKPSETALSTSTTSPGPVQPGDSWFAVPSVPYAGAHVMAATAGGPGWVVVGSACPLGSDACEGLVPAAWTSPDGLTWTRAPRVAAVDFGEMSSVAWNGSVLYAAGTTGSLTSGTVWRSADGLVWEIVGSGSLFDLGQCFEGCPALGAVAAGTPGVVVGGVRLVVSGEHIEVVPALWFSPDGNSWDVVEGSWLGPKAAGAVPFSDIVAAGPGFVATGQVCDPRCRATTWTSPDGLDWTGPADLPNGRDAVPLRIAASRERLVVIAERCPADPCAAVTTWSSADARTWSEAPLEGEPDFRLHGLLAESRGRYIVLGSLGGQITVWASTDGATWERHRSEGLPALGRGDGVLELHLGGGPLGALLIGEDETAEGVTTRAWISPGG